MVSQAHNQYRKYPSIFLACFLLTACVPASVDSYSQTDTSATSSNSSYSQRTEERKSQDSENNSSYSYSDNNQQAQAESNSKAEDTDSINNNNSGLGRFILLFTMFCLLVGVGGIFLIEKLATSASPRKNKLQANALGRFSKTKKNPSKQTKLPERRQQLFATKTQKETYQNKKSSNNLLQDLDQKISLLKIELSSAKFEISNLRSQINTLEKRILQLEKSDFIALSSQSSNQSNFPSSFFFEEKIYDPLNKIDHNDEDLLNNLLVACNQKNFNFVKQFSPIFVTLKEASVVDNFASDNLSQIYFDIAERHQDSLFFIVRLEKQDYLFPDFTSPYYQQLHWLYANPQIFQRNGSGVEIAVTQSAKVVLVAEGQWSLQTPGQCSYV